MTLRIVERKVIGTASEYAIQLEKALLGGLLRESAELALVSGMLTPEDFYSPRHAAIFNVMVVLMREGNPIDAASVYGRLHDEVPFSYIAEIHDEALPSTLAYTAELVREVARKRQIRATLHEAIEQFGLPECDVQMQWDVLRGDFLKLLSRDDQMPMIGTGIMDLIQRIAARRDQPPGTLIRTGLLAVDNYVGALQEGSVVVIAGRTSMGKTAFAQNWLKYIAWNGHYCAWFSVEGSSEACRQRLLSMESGIGIRQILEGGVDPEEDGKLLEASGAIGKLPIFAYDGIWQWENIKARIQMLKFREPQLRVVFVDYLGLITCLEGNDRFEEVTFISADFKRLMAKLQMTGVMLVQINRQTESRKNHRPTLGDLRDSGAVEQDADAVLLLFRPWYYDKRADETLTEVIVAKNRDGATGDVSVSFNAACMKFSNRSGL